ncbi:hypothetical protein [Microbulbifer epialgicus]|uniref:Uncharacterized protein n=1 Tax=Microbulbifer epialgicus TaxID=393907 RepID=A0ABV4NTG2_9GAMM
MIKLIKYTTILLCAVLNSPIVNANFGFGPCCPPSVCGIIPCDSGCAGAAINQMGTNVSNSLTQLNSAHQNLTSAVQDSIDSMSDLGTDINDVLIQQNQDLLDGFSASTNRIELANLQALKSSEANTEHLVRSFVHALKEREVARAVSENNLIFGDASQPVSGESGAEQAEAIKRVNVQIKQLLEESTNGFMSYINDSNNTYSGAGIGQHQVNALKSISEFNNLASILTKDVLDQTDFQKLQVLIGLIVSQYPLANMELNSQYVDYELERKRHISMLGIVYSSLLIPATARTGLVSGEWKKYYHDTEENEEGYLGLQNLYDAEVNGRLTDPEWWASVLRLNQTGLEREKIFQMGLSLQMNERLSSISQSSNQLMAVLLANKSESYAKNLLKKYENTKSN